MTPALSARRALATGFAALAVLALTLGGWGSQARLAGAVLAQGRVEVDLNRQAVQHPDGGVVARIAVHEGEHVVAGQVLMVLDGQSLRSQARQLRDQLYDLQARQARLQAERDGTGFIHFAEALCDAARARPEIAALIDGQVNLYAARAETFARQTAQLGQETEQIARQIDGIDAQIGADERQIAIIAEDLDAQRRLRAKGLAPLGSVLALEKQQAQLEGAKGALEASRAQAKSRATETEIAALKLAAARREDAATRLRRIAPQILDLSERLREAAGRIDRLEIRAPVSGIAYDLAVTSAQAVIRPAEPILYIVPQDRPLIAAARVPPTAVDDVAPGARVRLRILAFHDRFAPDVIGRVTMISPDRLSDQRSGRDYYRVRIALPPGQRSSDGHPILPGMPVEAFIRTGSQTLLDYVLGPVYAYFDHAFREG
jgi:HlyD family secretion protein